MSLRLRAMQPDDCDSLAQIEAQCFSQPWSAQALAEECGVQTACFFVACAADGKICGYIGSHFVLGEGYITNVAVSPTQRRQGVGKALVQALLQYADRIDARFVTLEARASNLSAIALYAGCGFVQIGVRPHFYSAPIEDAVLMTWYAEGGEGQNA